MVLGKTDFIAPMPCAAYQDRTKCHEGRTKDGSDMRLEQYTSPLGLSNLGRVDTRMQGRLQASLVYVVCGRLGR